jgi:hypothetical protein
LLCEICGEAKMVSRVPAAELLKTGTRDLSRHQSGEDSFCRDAGQTDFRLPAIDIAGKP